jgi:hypothetical protein
VGLKGSLKRLERLAEGNVVSIPQRAGPPARFPECALADAYVNAVRRECGEDVEEHPLSTAARNSSDPKWRDSLVAGVEEVPEPPEDLSE